jgi:hypothetical protein
MMIRRFLPVLILLPFAVALYLAVRGAPANTAVRFVVYRPSTAVFYIEAWRQPGTRLDVDHQPESTVPFGRPGDVGLACFQHDLNDPLGLRVYSGGIWYFSGRKTRPADGDLLLGQSGDVPFCADFDGDGRPDNGVFRGGEWLVRTSGVIGGADLRFRFGNAGDRPVLLNVPGRGNGTDRRNLVYGVYRQGIWHIDLDGDGTVDATYAFGGLPQDIPLLIPRWSRNGTGSYSLAIFRDGVWFVREDPNDSATTQFYFGTNGDLPSVMY